MDHTEKGNPMGPVVSPQTNSQGKPESLTPDLDMAVGFLKLLHP